MSLLTDLENDIHKILAFLPFVAAVNPAMAKDAEIAKAVITALQPTIAAVQAAAGGTADHAALVAGVSDAIVQSSSQLAGVNVLSGTTDQHIQATAQLVNAAVAISGLAAPTVSAQ